MPKTIKQPGLTPKIRKRISGRNAKQEVVCKRGTTETPATTIVASSIYSLKLEPIKGSEVYKALSLKNHFDVDIEKLYNDIYPIYARLKKLRFNKECADTHKYGVSTNWSLYHILTEIKKLLPAWMDINVDQDEETEKYFVTAYGHCEFKCFWHTIEVKNVALKLKKENKALHDLFLSFIHSFSSYTTGIGALMWYEGFMEDHYEYMMEENLENYKDERDLKDPEDVAFLKQYQDDIDDYKTGLAKQYERLISNSKLMNRLELMKRAKRFKAGHPIANLIYQGAYLMTGFDFDDYKYYPYGDINDVYHLSLDMQLNIIWDESDNLTKEYDHTLDCQAQEGIQEAYLSVELTPKLKEFDVKKLEEARRWPLQVSNYFQRANEFIVEFLKEKDE